MNLENSTWYGNDNGGRLEIYLNKPKPIALHGYPIVNNIPDSFVKFGWTDKDADASQTIVPYLETAKVEPFIPGKLRVFEFICAIAMSIEYHSSSIICCWFILQGKTWTWWRYCIESISL